jgi:hypothetical protein
MLTNIGGDGGAAGLGWRTDGGHLHFGATVVLAPSGRVSEAEGPLPTNVSRGGLGRARGLDTTAGSNVGKK